MPRLPRMLRTAVCSFGTEDLRRDTLKELRTIFDSAGIAMADDAMADLVARTTLEQLPADQRGPDKPRQDGQVGKYASVFSHREIELMEAIMGPNLERFAIRVAYRATARRARVRRELIAIHAGRVPALSTPRSPTRDSRPPIRPWPHVPRHTAVATCPWRDERACIKQRVACWEHMA